MSIDIQVNHKVDLIKLQGTHHNREYTSKEVEELFDFIDRELPKILDDLEI